MAEIDQALALRMADCLRKFAGHLNNDHDPRTVNLTRIKETCLEAEAIVAELPEPVDPDLVEARRLAEHQSSVRGYLYHPDAFWQGHRDDGDDVQIALAAIKRGRELQKEGR